MDSIIQEDKTRCFICGMYACGDPLDRHHIFGGSCRKLSEKYGLTVYLHHNKCHIFGKDSAHANAAIRRRLEQIGHAKAMEYYRWTEEEFRRIFGRNYL